MLRPLFYGILLAALCCCCNLRSNQNEKINALVDQEINDLKLESYPEIDPCEDTSSNCFTKQLTEILQISLPESISNEKATKEDTLWIYVTVSNKGIIKTRFEQQTTLTSILQQSIDSTLQDINPIKPGYVRSTNVTSNFKLPLILNKEETIE